MLNRSYGISAPYVSDGDDEYEPSDRNEDESDEENTNTTRRQRSGDTMSLDTSFDPATEGR